MKLALIGGGGLRAPLFVGCALRRAEALGIHQIALMDTDASQLALMSPICEALVTRAGSAMQITATDRTATALEGADFVITTIRPGGIAGRVADEDIAAEVGVLGQETTGAGGFAMALRSIPTILDYARQMQAHCPDAWLINFTNPAGLVTQALHDAGHARAIGICDSANGAQTAAARWLGVPTQAVEADLFGLNHLSFAPALRHQGRDVLAEMLADRAFLATTAMAVFDADLVARRGEWINEYLWYYWYIDAALASQARKGGRGAEIARLNETFLPRLRAAAPGARLDIHEQYEAARSGSYMASARPKGSAAAVAAPEGEGYAGVALDVIGALTGGPAIRTGLNVRNGGALSELAASDVVEVSCKVTAGAITPVAFGPMPELERALIATVKLYERMTVAAIAARDKALAIDALTVHPLVQSRPRAGQLTDRFLTAHAAYTGVWS